MTPAQNPRAEPGDDAPPDSVHAAVLIIEDSRVSASLLRQTLTSLSLANPLVHIDHGDRAVEWLEDSARTGRVPALILLDIQLPGRDGMEILRWLRRQPALALVPVVILTSSADRADMEEGYDLGIASYLTKPVGFDALRDILRHLPLRWALLAPSGRG